MGWLWWWITDWWCSKILYCLCSKMTSFQPSQGVDWNQLWFHLIKTFLVYYIFLGTCLDNFTSKFEGKPHTNCFASSSRNKLFFETCPDSLKECYLFIYFFFYGRHLCIKAISIVQDLFRHWFEMLSFFCKLWWCDFFQNPCLHSTVGWG